MGYYELLWKDYWIVKAQHPIIVPDFYKVLGTWGKLLYSGSFLLYSDSYLIISASRRYIWLLSSISIILLVRKTNKVMNQCIKLKLEITRQPTYVVPPPITFPNTEVTSSPKWKVLEQTWLFSDLFLMLWFLKVRIWIWHTVWNTVCYFDQPHGSLHQKVIVLLYLWDALYNNITAEAHLYKEFSGKGSLFHYNIFNFRLSFRNSWSEKLFI